MKSVIKYFSILFLIGLLSACKTKSVAEEENLDTPPRPTMADFELLFLGNSHSSVNGLPDLIATLIKTGLPDKTVYVDLAPGGNYLAERLDDGVTLPLLTSRSWTHVSLQAQKYSSSGDYWYPTDAAEEWIRRIKSQNGTPIMFPEWPRRGNREEGQRIHDLHLGIASREAACVAPVGLAWELSLANYPNLVLHAADGNHSNLNGALLTAFVFFEVITKQSANELPFIPSINVSEEVQNQLRNVATETVAANSPCPLGF